MKISGLTIIRNAILNDYPVLESIMSILPVVDEMIVCIGEGEDDTENLIKSIGSPKIKIHFSTWDMGLRKDGRVLGVETNKAMEYVSGDSDWIFYIQADEVVHEKYHPVIREAAERYANNPKVEGLLFKYLHFYATYDYVGDSRRWYNCETRIIKNDRAIQSYRDAQGFRRGDQKIRVVPIDAFVYHYGWVKSPQQMKVKQKNVSRFWVEDSPDHASYMASEDFFDFNEFDSLKKFTETHPKVMEDRIKRQNWKIDLDISRKNVPFKDRVLYGIEKLTGKRLFAFRNHTIIKA